MLKTIGWKIIPVGIVAVVASFLVRSRDCRVRAWLLGRVARAESTSRREEHRWVFFPPCFVLSAW